MIGTPDKTCALIVGVGAYGLGEEWKLQGAVAGAKRFAEWVAAQGVDPARIYLRLDPTADKVKLALYALRDECKSCHTVLVYWAGHGFETEWNRRGLFVSDTSALLTKAFAIDDIIAFLRSEAPQFRTQIGIIDACATGRRSAQETWESIQMTAQLPRGGLDFRFAFSAPTGRETLYPREGEASVFTERLLDLLKLPAIGVDALLAELGKEYPIAVRDGGSAYWSESRARTDAWAIEAETRRIAGNLNLEDAKWRALAKRLEKSVDLPNATFAEIVEKIAGLERKLAGKLCAALLLRGGEIAKLDLRTEIQQSSRLAPSYDAAVELLSKFKAFENPSYLIWTDYLPNGALGAKSAWFFAGTEDCSAEEVRKWEHAAAFDDAIDEVTDHMLKNDVSAETPIHVVAPLRFLLAPQSDILQAERDFALVYRERTRADWMNEFRRKRPIFRDRLRDVKRRAAEGFTLRWFAHIDSEQLKNIELPAVETGSAADASDQLSKLIAELVPFAAITRYSIQQAGAVAQDGLETAIAGAEFAKIPVRVYSSRSGNAYPILAHITLIWDDRELPAGYFH